MDYKYSVRIHLHLLVLKMFLFMKEFCDDNLLKSDNKVKILGQKKTVSREARKLSRHIFQNQKLSIRNQIISR